MINEIITSINTSISEENITSTSPANEEIYGIARIHNLEEEKYPAIFLSGGWNKIDLDDTIGLLTYHRVLKITEEEDDDSFDFRSSINTTLKDVYDMTLFVALSKEYDYDTAVHIKNAIPNFISNGNYSAVYITKGEIETNEDEIISDEYGNTDYTRFKSSLNLFKINYQIELIKC